MSHPVIEFSNGQRRQWHSRADYESAMQAERRANSAVNLRAHQQFAARMRTPPAGKPQPKARPAQHTAEARALAELRAEAKANAAIVAKAHAAAAEAAAKPWLPRPEPATAGPTEWF